MSAKNFCQTCQAWVYHEANDCPKNPAESSLAASTCSASDCEKRVEWIAWTSDGRGYLFRAPNNWSMAMACDYAEKIWKVLFVTVQTLK